MKLSQYILGAALATTALTACTDLDETLYDQVSTSNFYNTKQDVIRISFRPFEHCFWSIQSRMVLNEITADQLITPTRDSWWDDGGQWRKLHYHTWDNTQGQVKSEWTGLYQGIGQCNYVLEDMELLDPAKFGFTTDEFNALKTQSRVLRAWLYLRALDSFRNVPLVVSFNDMSKNSDGQVDPRVIFDFIESEIQECIPLLQKKLNPSGGNGGQQGQFTQAAAASILVRLYLNAKVYIGEDRWDDCARYAEKIVAGEYGNYTVAPRWDAAFDWNNETCDEVIFGFPAASGYSHWHYQGDTYWWTTPNLLVRSYFNDAKNKQGDHNCKYACSPSFNPDGTKITGYDLGMTVDKFRKYPGDERLKLYRNLGNSTREGLFLYGYLENEQGERVSSPYGDYDLYIRDAVGQFHGMAPDQWIDGKSSSNLTEGDHNSGYHFVKYPLYSDDDEGQLEADYTEVRLPEIIYSLAECKFRKGDKQAAADLLNGVRQRNYPADQFVPLTASTLTEQELLDEWGREFFAEGRRRMDLIRFGKFNTANWWDKQADADAHTAIFPIPLDALNANPALIQNPGY